MAKIIIECEVELAGSDPLQGIQLHLMRGNEWSSVILFMGSRQRIRDGKHLRVNNETMTVVKVGGDLQQDPTAQDRCQHRFENGKCAHCGIRPHEDGDYSYLCGNEYCRCLQ